MTVGTFLKERRRAKGLTQFEVSMRTGIQPRALSNWENGRVKPGVDMLERLADALEFELPWIDEDEAEGDSGATRRYLPTLFTHDDLAAGL